MLLRVCAKKKVLQRVAQHAQSLKRVVAIWPLWRYERGQRGERLAEASEEGRICFMRVIDALLQEKRAKQA